MDMEGLLKLTVEKDGSDLHLAVGVSPLIRINGGLVLVTGPSGSGKSTTLAAMFDFINNNRSVNIVTVEDCRCFPCRSKGSG